MSSKIKVMIVEDHAIFREGLKRVLGGMRDVEVVGEAENGAVFLQKLQQVNPDIVLMDLKMPVMDGFEATERALKKYPRLKIIILTMFGQAEYLYSMLKQPICGFMLKTTSMTDLEKAVQNVSQGRQYYSPEVSQLLAKKFIPHSSIENFKLTSRENEVLLLLCKGISTMEISHKLNLSKRTVDGYRARLLEKTNQSSPLGLVLFALKNKLVNLDEL